MNDIFGNLERSGYEEIASYGPPFLMELKEMDANYQFAGLLTDMMAKSMEEIVDNQFVLLMDSQTIGIMEVFIGIPVDETVSLESRKKNVLALLHAVRKFNKTTIIEIINSYASAVCQVGLHPGTLKIEVSFLENPANFMKDIIKIILDKMPCHLQLDLSAEINTVNPTVNYIVVAADVTKVTEIGGVTIE